MDQALAEPPSEKAPSDPDPEAMPDDIKPDSGQEWEEKASKDIRRIRLQMGLKATEMALILGWSSSLQLTLERNPESHKVRAHHLWAVLHVARYPMEVVERLPKLYEQRPDIVSRLEEYKERLDEWAEKKKAAGK